MEQQQVLMIICAKGLNVMITSEDAQTQMMGMVLSTMTLKKIKR